MDLQDLLDLLELVDDQVVYSEELEQAINMVTKAIEDDD